MITLKGVNHNGHPHPHSHPPSCSSKKEKKKEITQGEGAGREHIKYAVINNVNKQPYQSKKIDKE